MNKINPYNPIENFEKLSSREVETDNKDIKRSLDAKLSQGNIYRVISHSVSVLKQIERICDAALADSENYPDIQYYEKLKAQAKEALELIYVEPISIEDSV
ncbi:hypothetical protein IJ531_00010 [bacterium]|nr:hypothetical protein [bacterium]